MEAERQPASSSLFIPPGRAQLGLGHPMLPLAGSRVSSSDLMPALALAHPHPRRQSPGLYYPIKATRSLKCCARQGLGLLWPCHTLGAASPEPSSSGPAPLCYPSEVQSLLSANEGQGLLFPFHDGWGWGEQLSRLLQGEWGGGGGRASPVALSTSLYSR